MSRLLIAASGTGGHLFPALAVADAMPEGWTTCWLGVPVLCSDKVMSRRALARVVLPSMVAAGLSMSENMEAIVGKH